LLCDFGLSRIKHGLGQTSMTVCQGGDYRFVAPEISFGKDDTCVDQQSDIYSLAMTIYALGTRSPPFQDKKRLQACRAAADGERPPKHDSLGGLSAEHTEFLWFLMQMMWHQDPQRRPTISGARNFILRSDVMNLVQLPTPMAAVPYWIAWCDLRGITEADRLPISAENLALFLAFLSQMHSASIIRRTLAALRHWHEINGLLWNGRFRESGMRRNYMYLTAASRHDHLSRLNTFRL